MINRTVEQITEAEKQISQPLVCPALLNNPNFEFVHDDARLEVIRRLGGTSIQSETETTPLLTSSERTHFHFLYNLESFITRYSDDEPDIQLRDHQLDVFTDIYHFLTRSKSDQNGLVNSRGYIELPTGSGKTAIFSTLVETLNRPLPGTVKKPKSLILVPKLDLVDQTIGGDGERGFAKFTNDTKVTEYHAKTKDLSGDAVVMTYQSLVGAINRGEISKEDFGLIICDEAHRALGGKTRTAIDHIAQGNLLLGLTASPEFTSKHVDSLFTEKIHNMSLREAIEMGLLSPVRCYAIASDAKLDSLISSSDYTESELAVLIENEWRNQKAIEFAKRFVEMGKSGIIACVPGQNTKHAINLAEALSQENITDPYTGELRKIRAQAVSGNDNNRDLIYRAFENGELDLLTYVDLLTEGWDSTRAKFLINLRPTTSPINAIQRLGRVLRKSHNPSDIATVIEFMDQSDKQSYTFFHVLGLETIEQGLVFNKAKSHKPSQDDDNNLPKDEEYFYDDFTKSLPFELLSAIKQINHIELKEAYIHGEDDKEASVSKYHFAREVLKISLQKLDEIIEELGIVPQVESIEKPRSKPREILSAEEQKAIQNHEWIKTENAPEDVASIDQLSKELSVTYRTMKNIIEELEIEGVMYWFGTKRTLGFSYEQQLKIREHDKLTIPSAPEGVAALDEVATTFGIGRNKLRRIMKAELIFPKKYRLNSNKVGYGLTPEEIHQLGNSVLLQVKPAPDNVISLAQLAKKLDASATTIEKLLPDFNIETKLFSFNKKPGKSITDEEAELVSSHEYFSLVALPEDYITINNFLTKYKVGRKRFNKIAERVFGDLSNLERYRTGTRICSALNPEQHHQILHEIQQNDQPE